MKYIRIKNKGLMEIGALMLLGASSKRNDSNKIGIFGTGNKYALAYLLRNDYNVKVFSGLKEITITTKPEKFREQIFNVIYIDGERTSITIEMGKDWEFWQAIREIYCNAIDEGGHSMDFLSDIEPHENETHFYIDTKKDVMEFVSKFDDYFATKKKILFECKKGRILEKTGTVANIYRKGIRCFNTNKTSVFDYDFNEITVDENRLIRYFWQIEEKVWDLIYRCDNAEVIMQILHNSYSHDFLEGCISDISTINCSQASDAFKDCIRGVHVAPSGFAGLLNPDELHNHLILPTKVYQCVRGLLGDENVGDKFKISKNCIYREIEPNELQAATLKGAIYFFSEVGFEIHYEIIIALFDEKKVLGSVHEGKIILSDICVAKGVNEVVNTIIEEFIHLKYSVSDETRSFQTAMITEFIAYMKTINSFVI